MVEIVSETLENEMDLVLAHKKAMSLGEHLHLTLATQTVFATAISEISREIIEKTNTGVLSLGLSNEGNRYALQATIRCGEEECYDPNGEGFQYAKKLVPFYQEYLEDKTKVIDLKINLPASAKVTPASIQTIIYFFENVMPFTPYEAVKRKMNSINELAEEREEKLKQSKYLDDKKNEFISIASHELKTPVTIIKAYAQLAKNSGKNDCSTRVQTFINKIEDQAGRLSSLIHQLLDVSKIERDNLDYKMEVLSLNTFINEVTLLIKHTIPNHELRIELDEDALVKLDKYRMEQVFANLLGNAAKYSANSTKIAFTTALTKDKGAVVGIKDEGLGMSADNLKKIFEKFHRNEEVINKYSGLGMGLYISSSIIHEHGGEIWVESELGKGSTFYFSIPILDQKI